MKIVYLHGFNSDGNGNTAKKLKNNYKDEMITPSYDYQNADKGYNLLNSLISGLSSNDEVILCGTSLGGFWANYFSEKYNLKAILINPSLTPDTSLLKFIGTNKNFSNGKVIEFTKEDAELYSKYELSESPNIYKSILLGAKDTVIDHKKSAEKFKDHQVIIDQDEEHQIKDVSKIIKLIDEAINSYPLEITDETYNLNEHVINAPPNDIQTKEKYADLVWDMLNKSYEKIGGLKGNGFSSKEDMIKNMPFWKLIKKNGKIVAVSLYKDKSGRKSVAGGTDGTSEGKDALKMMKDEDISQKRAYTEISGPMLSFIYKNNPDLFDHCVPYSKVEMMINDEIRRPQSTDAEMMKYQELKQFFYQRFIGKQWITKLMIGTTGVKMD